MILVTCTCQDYKMHHAPMSDAEFAKRKAADVVLILEKMGNPSVYTAIGKEEYTVIVSDGKDDPGLQWYCKHCIAAVQVFWEAGACLVNHRITKEQF